jgi:hypothetical protein
MNTRRFAEQCAASVPTSFSLFGALMLVEIIYYTFNLWKECHATHAAPDESAKTFMASQDSRRLARRAKRATLRSIRRSSADLSESESDQLNDHMLAFVNTASDDVVAACCGEPTFLDPGDNNYA